MRQHGTIETLNVALHHYLTASKKYTLPQLSQIANIIHGRLMDVFAQWTEWETVLYHMEEQIIEVPSPDEDRPYPLPFHLMIKDDISLPKSENYKAEVLQWQHMYDTELKREEPDWNFVYNCMERFSARMNDIVEILKKDTMQELPGVRMALREIITINLRG